MVLSLCLSNLALSAGVVSVSLAEEVLSALIIQQTPQHLLVTPERQQTRLDCHHGDNSYPYMLWYQQRDGQGTMELVGLLHYENANLEKKFHSGRFNITGHSKGKAALVISNMAADDKAVYFCAASQHSVTSLFPL